MAPFFAALCVASTFEITAHLRSRANIAELQTLYDSVADPHALQYQQFLTRSALAQLVGATDERVDAASAWLRDLNGQDVRVSALHDRVSATFSDTDTGTEVWSARGLPLSRPDGVTIVTRRGPGGADAPPQRQRTASNVPAHPQSTYSISAQKKAYGIPVDLAATNEQTLQMVWGPGTFGYSPEALAAFRAAECPGLNLDRIQFDTKNHGTPGGDNFMEGSLDVRMIASFGMNASTLVSNTNASTSTEEGDGFGLAFLDFVTELASRPTVPHVLSLSLGSLSAASCTLLCQKAAQSGRVSLAECEDYLQTQRQVCMFLSTEQSAKIDRALMALGLRGVTIFGSSGDGGSHWSFGKFPGWGKVPRELNKIGCEFQFPIYPSPSPYVVSVGGTDWEGGDPRRPTMWSGSGGGFSWQFAQPAYQQAAVRHYLSSTQGLPPPESFNASGRAYPDISAVAVEGTSMSSPTFAGIFTLITDARLNAGLKPLGPLGPRLWHVAQAFPGEAFEDITTGDSKTSCSNGFPAAKGWDPTTGFGRPVWAGLVKHFAADDSLPRAPRQPR